MAGCTIRRCDCSTRATPASRSPSGSRCRPRWTGLHTRGYYGSVNHNVKAVYQLHGLVRRQPGQLWQHPPEVAAPSTSSPRWALESVVSVAKRPSTKVISGASNTSGPCGVRRREPRRRFQALYADTLEQLAYGAENAPWRNFFLAGATELRVGNVAPPRRRDHRPRWPSSPRSRSSDALAISGQRPAAWDLDLVLDVTFTDTGANFRLTLRNGVLVYRSTPADPHGAYHAHTAQQAPVAGRGRRRSDRPRLDVTGDPGTLPQLLAVLDRPDRVPHRDPDLGPSRLASISGGLPSPTIGPRARPPTGDVRRPPDHAIPAGIAGALLCALVPLLPVNQTTAVVNWPQGVGADGFVHDNDRPCWCRAPRAIDVSIPCTAVASLPDSGGLVFATIPRPASTPAATASSRRANADTVVVAFRDTVAAVAPRVASRIRRLQHPARVGRPGRRRRGLRRHSWRHRNAARR